MDQIFFQRGDYLQVMFLADEPIAEYMNANSATRKQALQALGQEAIDNSEGPDNGIKWFVKDDLTVPFVPLHAVSISDDGEFVVNVGEVRSSMLAELREKRRGKLEELDIEFMRALERGDTAGKAKIVEKKQRLRDMPTNSKITKEGDWQKLRALTLDDFMEG